MHVGYGVRCRVISGYDWTDIFCRPWGEGERPVLLRCLAVSADASSNQTCHRIDTKLHKTIMLLTAKLVVFCSVISQGKVVALDRWGGKWNHLSMTHRLITDFAKNYCNRALIFKSYCRKCSHMFFIGTQCIELNMKWIGSRVEEIWPFAYVGGIWNPILGEGEGEVVGGQRWHH